MVGINLTGRRIGTDVGQNNLCIIRDFVRRLAVIAATLGILCIIDLDHIAGFVSRNLQAAVRRLHVIQDIIGVIPGGGLIGRHGHRFIVRGFRTGFGIAFLHVVVVYDLIGVAVDGKSAGDLHIRFRHGEGPVQLDSRIVGFPTGEGVPCQGGIRSQRHRCTVLVLHGCGQIGCACRRIIVIVINGTHDAVIIDRQNQRSVAGDVAGQLGLGAVHDEAGFIGGGCGRRSIRLTSQFFGFVVVLGVVIILDILIIILHRILGIAVCRKGTGDLHIVCRHGKGGVLLAPAIEGIAIRRGGGRFHIYGFAKLVRFRCGHVACTGGNGTRVAVRYIIGIASIVQLQNQAAVALDDTFGNGTSHIGIIGEAGVRIRRGSSLHAGGSVFGIHVFLRKHAIIQGFQIMNHRVRGVRVGSEVTGEGHILGGHGERAFNNRRIRCGPAVEGIAVKFRLRGHIHRFLILVGCFCRSSCCALGCSFAVSIGNLELVAFVVQLQSQAAVALDGAFGHGAFRTGIIGEAGVGLRLRDSGLAGGTGQLFRIAGCGGIGAVQSLLVMLYLVGNAALGCEGTGESDILGGNIKSSIRNRHVFGRPSGEGVAGRRGGRCHFHILTELIGHGKGFLARIRRNKSGIVILDLILDAVIVDFENGGTIAGDLVLQQRFFFVDLKAVSLFRHNDRFGPGLAFFGLGRFRRIVVIFDVLHVILDGVWRVTIGLEAALDDYVFVGHGECFSNGPSAEGIAVWRGGGRSDGNRFTVFVRCCFRKRSSSSRSSAFILVGDGMLIPGVVQLQGQGAIARDRSAGNSVSHVGIIGKAFIRFFLSFGGNGLSGGTGHAICITGIGRIAAVQVLLEVLDDIGGICVGAVGYGYRDIVTGHGTGNRSHVRRVTRNRWAFHAIRRIVGKRFHMRLIRLFAGQSRIRDVIRVHIVDGQRILILGVVHDEFVESICGDHEVVIISIDNRITGDGLDQRIHNSLQVCSDLCLSGFIRRDCCCCALQIVVHDVIAYGCLIVDIHHQVFAGVAADSAVNFIAFEFRLCIKINIDKLSTRGIRSTVCTQHLSGIFILILNGVGRIGNCLIHEGNRGFIPGCRQSSVLRTVAGNCLGKEHIRIGVGDGNSRIFYRCSVNCDRVARRISVLRRCGPGRFLGVSKGNHLARRLNLHRLTRNLGCISGDFGRHNCHIRTGFRVTREGVLHATSIHNGGPIGIDCDNCIVASTAELPFGIQGQWVNNLLFFHKAVAVRSVGIPTVKRPAFSAESFSIPGIGSGQVYHTAFFNALGRDGMFVPVGHKIDLVGGFLPDSVYLQVVGRHCAVPIDLCFAGRIQRPSVKDIVVVHAARSARLLRRFSFAKQLFILQAGIRNICAIFKCYSIRIAGIVKPQLAIVMSAKYTANIILLILPAVKGEACNGLLILVRQRNPFRGRECSVYFAFVIQTLNVIGNCCTIAFGSAI